MELGINTSNGTKETNRREKSKDSSVRCRGITNSIYNIHLYENFKICVGSIALLE